MNSDWWYNWWASYDELRIGASVCPLSPEGQRQTADAVLASAEWHHAFLIAAIGTAVIALLAVLWTYETESMGDPFRRRWLKGLGLTAFVSALLVLFWLALGVKVTTSGCEFGNILTRIPALYALGRASVALGQGPVLFVLFTLLLTRTARIWRRRRWLNNIYNPF
jgi:hypothetical protein